MEQGRACREHRTQSSPTAWDQQPQLWLCQYGKHARWQGMDGLARFCAGLSSCTWFSTSTACLSAPGGQLVWPPCSGDFLNEDANGHGAGVPGATPAAERGAGALLAQSGSGGRHGPCRLPGDQAKPRLTAERDQDTSLPAQQTRCCQSAGHPLRHPLPPKPRSAGEIRDMPQGQRKSL